MYKILAKIESKNPLYLKFRRKIVKRSSFGRQLLENEFKGDCANVDWLYNNMFGDLPKPDRFFRDKISKYVFYRTNLVQGFVKNRANAKIASIACGSALELRDCPESNTYHCFDTDQKALDNIVDKPNVIKFKTNVITHKFDKDYDFIYSCGLFDYFDQRLSKRVFKKLYNSLAPNGTLIIGNVDKDSKDYCIFKNLLEWDLIIKSKQEMLDWAEGIDQKMVMSDPWGELNYLIVRK